MVGNKEPVQQHHIGLTNAQVNVSFNEEESRLLTEGYELMAAEKKQTFKQAIRIHWRAALWSFLLSWALVMEGYDGQLLSGFYGQRSFLQRFGNVEGPDGKKLLSANIQAAIGNVGLPGNFLGLWFAGYGATRWGYRPIYIFGMILMILMIFLFVFCQSLGMLIASQALVNIPWGIFQTLTTAYAAELCPIALRGYLTGFVVMAWNIGMFISALVLRGASEVDSAWSWRGPYCAQWVWPIPLLIIAYLAPESPWHHIRKSEFNQAKEIVSRLAGLGHYTDRQLDSYIAYMKHTDDLDKAESAGGSWKDMFRGTNLRRTEIMFGVWGLQNWCGNGILGLGVELLETAGMTSATAYTVNVVTMAANIIAVACGWFLLPRFGRRPLFMLGLMSLGGTLIIIGILSVVRQTPGVLYMQGAMMVVCTFWFQANINPLTYAIAGEIPATRLRPQAIAMGRAFYVVSSVPLYQLQPRMSSPKPAGWGWGTRCAWFWLGCNILSTTWVFFRLPETGGFTFAELDILFGNKISARKFKHVVVHDELASGEGKTATMENVENEKDVPLVEVQNLDA